ncbi:MAG: ABC transporter ATP-binding protein [Actinomycetota bacterium]
MQTMTPGPVLEMAGLTKRYGDRTVVDDLSLSVERGEIFGILGTNGAGKTTSVECAQGLRRPDGGQVRVLGLDPIRDRSALAGRVGSQLQESNLPDRLRVGEALRLFATTKTQADEALDRWDLGDIAKVPFARLSGGQRQRLFLALALLNRPEVVFLDELTQGLDPDARRSVWRLIEQVRDQGTTVVLVTHFMSEAEALCDRVVVMTDGRMVAAGTPDELVDRHGRGVRVRFSGTAEDLDWVRSLADVHEASVRGADIECWGRSTMIAELGHGLVERGRNPIAIRVEQQGLEDALLSLLHPVDNAAAARTEAAA